MSDAEMTPERMLNGIERHVASLYAFSLRLASVSITPRLERRLVRMAFLHTEMLERLTRDTDPRVLDPDEALEVAVPLNRVLRHLERMLPRWQGDSERSHLAAAADHLGDAASGLLDKLVAAQWIQNQEALEELAALRLQPPSTIQ